MAEIMSQNVQNGVTTTVVNRDKYGHSANKGGMNFSQTGSVFANKNAPKAGFESPNAEKAQGGDDANISQDPNSLKGEVSGLQAKIANAEASGAAAQAQGRQAAQTGAQINQQMTAMQQQQKSDANTIESRNAQLKSLIKEAEQLNTQNKELSAEYEKAMANGDQATADRALSQLLGVTDASTSIHRKTNDLVGSNMTMRASMQKNAVQFGKTVQAQQACMKQSLSTTQQVADIAANVGAISQVVSMGGKAMVAAGNALMGASLGTGAPAAALMITVGSAADTLGQVGNATSQVTLMTCKFAEGDIGGGLGYAASATGAVTSAIDSVGQLGGKIENAKTLADNSKAASEFAANEANKAMMADNGISAKDVYNKMNSEGMTADQAVNGIGVNAGETIKNAAGEDIKVTESMSRGLMGDRAAALSNAGEGAEFKNGKLIGADGKARDKTTGSLPKKSTSISKSTKERTTNVANSLKLASTAYTALVPQGGQQTAAATAPTQQKSQSNGIYLATRNQTKQNAAGRGNGSASTSQVGTGNNNKTLWAGA